MNRTVLSTLVSAVGIATCGCSVMNAIDVCDRGAGGEGELNLRAEGTQRTWTTQALTTMPDGRAFAVFSSDFSGGDADRVELRGVRFDDSATAVSTCSVPSEFTYVDVDPTAPPIQHLGAAVAPPASESYPGMIVWTAVTEMDSQVFGQHIDPAVACPLYATSAIQLSDEPPGKLVSAPVIARIADEDFLVVWVAALDGVSTRVRGRAIRATFVNDFLPLREPLTGDVVEDRPVDISPDGVFMGPAVVSIDADRIAIAWHRAQSGGYVVEVGFFTPTLETLVPPFQVSDWSRDVQADLSLAWDGRQLLVVWAQEGDSGVFQLLARFLTADGRYLASSVSPEGEPFPLATSPNDQETDPAALALPGGGFFVGWSATGRHSDGAGFGIRGAVFDAGGNRRFVNRACDQTDFQVNSAVLGDQVLPSFTVLPDGAIAGVWTDYGINGSDSMGASIRAAVMRPMALFPIE